MKESSKATERTLRRFSSDRFGLFIHWGLYALPGGRWKGKRMDYIGEWLQSSFRIPSEEYATLAARFNPVLFNAEEWVLAAKNAGMNYIVYTAKHHDGFAMYASEYDNYCIQKATPFKRDPLKELAEACRKYGMDLGIYYSHCLDWHERNAADPGSTVPKNYGMSWGNDWDFPETEQKKFAEYFESKVKFQIRELLSNYGKILLLWFDTENSITEEQSFELKQLVHSIQPECIVSSRIGHGMGDFGSLGDNQRPACRQGRFVLESPNTLNDTWGFKWDDHSWKSSAVVEEDLAKLGSRGINYLLNIGPRPDGRFPEPAMDILNELAVWKKKRQFTIADTQPSPFQTEMPWGWCTLFQNTLQLVLKRDWSGPIEIAGLLSKISKASCRFEETADKVILYPEEPKDDGLNVILLELVPPVQIRPGLYPQNGMLFLSPSAGKLENANGSCRLDLDGSLINWNHEGDGISWDISLPGPGNYFVSVFASFVL